MINAPLVFTSPSCLNCSNRKLKCHDTCSKYIAFTHKKDGFKKKLKDSQMSTMRKGWVLK